MSKRELQHTENGFEEFGGYMAAKRAKLNHQFNESNENGCESHIFAGVTININGHVNPTNLRALFLNHGGSYDAFPTSGTSFVIANNLSDATKRKWGSKTLRPEWVMQSIEAGEKLDHKKFFLYNFNEENNQKTLKEAFAPCVLALAPEKAQPLSPVKINDVDEIKDSPKKSNAKRLMAWEDGFLEEFWDHSRLHNISTMKRTLQQHVCKMRRSISTHSFSELKRYEEEVRSHQNNENGTGFDFSTSTTGAVLFLVDLDCFFVSVGRLTRPHLNNVPVVVTHFSGKKTVSSNSDIACASYEARKFGVKNGMWVSDAKQLCQDIQVIPYDFEAYQRVSMQFCNTVAGLTLDIEPGSCDEMLVDVTSVLKNVPGSSPLSLAAFLRRRIFEMTWCKASIGIGNNRLLAKLASKKAKPDGVFLIDPSNVEKVLQDQPVGDLTGIGYSLKEKFETQFGNIKTCGDLQKLKIEELKSNFGAKKGEILYNSSRGIDDASLQFDFERPKSISIDVNYGIRLTEYSQLEKLLMNIAKALSKRALEAEACGTKLNVTLLTQQKGAPEPKKSGGHGYVDVHNKSGSLINPTRNHLVLYKSIVSLLRSVNLPVNIYRGIGVHLTGLKFDFDGKGEVQQTLMTSLLKQQERSKPKPAEKPVEKPNGAVQSEVPAAQSSSNHTNKPSNPLKELMGIESIEDLDMNVLSALPEDIVKEVTEFFRIDKDKLISRNDSSNCNNDMPSTSRAAILRQELEKNSKPREETNNAEVASEDKESSGNIPDLSESFLGALPDDIREEIETEFIKIRAPDPPVPIILPIKPKQQQQQQFPSTSTKPVLNGHVNSAAPAPPIPNPEESEFDDEEEILRVVSINEGEKPESVPFNRINWWKYNRRDRIPRENHCQGFSIVSSSNVPKQFSLPALNDKTELADIRKIIRDGIDTLPNPTRDDLDGLIDYFDELLSGPFIKQTQILLKFLSRLSENPNTNLKWAKIFKLIIGMCQSKIRRLFGFPLELTDIEDDQVNKVPIPEQPELSA